MNRYPLWKYLLILVVVVAIVLLCAAVLPSLLVVCELAVWFAGTGTCFGRTSR